MASSITKSIYKNIARHGKQVLVVKCAVVAAADGLVTTAEAIHAGDVDGMSLVKFAVIPGATGPTDASDLYVYDALGNDLLAGQGVNAIMNTTKTQGVPSIGGVLAPQPIVDAISIAVSSNAVNGATFDIYLYFVEQA
jgi:hypothetical protein